MEDCEFLSLDKLDIRRLVVYEKWDPETPCVCPIKEGPKNAKRYRIKLSCCMSRRIGLLSEDGRGYHRYRGFNMFEAKKSPLPPKQAWQNVFNVSSKKSKKYYVRRVLDPTARVFEPNPQSIIEGLAPDAKVWKTHDNFYIGFVVIQQDDRVLVYGRTHDVITNRDIDETTDPDIDEVKTFTQLIKVYKPLDVFIGKSAIDGPECDGNTLLLRIEPPEVFRYAQIGSSVFEFSTDEPVTKYISNIGNNDVPYPFAESEHWCYDMTGRFKDPIQFHPNRYVIGYTIFTDSVAAENMTDVRLVAPRNIDCIRTELSPDEQTSIGSVRTLTVSCNCFRKQLH